MVCLAADGWGLWFPLPSLPVALLCLVLPWLWLGGMRYLPIGRWFRAAACFLATGLWTYLAPWALDRILMASGSLTDHPYSLAIEANLFCWTDPALVTGNVLVLIYLSFALRGPALPGDWPLAGGKGKTIKTAPRRSVDAGPPSQGCDIVRPSIGRCNAKIPPGTGYIDHRPSYIAPGSGRVMRAPTVEEPSNHGANRNPVSGGHFKTSRRCFRSASRSFLWGSIKGFGRAGAPSACRSNGG